MKRLDRHIFQHVFLTSLMVLLVFAVLVNLFALLDEIKHDYGLKDVLIYIGLTSPRRIDELLPYVVFLGALISLGNLAHHSELVVMRTAGVSAARLFGSVCVPALTLLLGGMAIGEFVAPKMEEAAEVHKTKVRYGEDTIQLSKSYWYREGPLYMKVDAISDDGEMLNVTHYWRSADGELERALQARSARYVAKESPYWLLQDVTVTEIIDQRSEVQQFEQLEWPGKATPEVLSVRVLVEPAKLSIFALREQIAYMEREGLNSASYVIALYAKLLRPLAILGLCLLALGFVLGPLRQVGMGLRLSVGVIAGLLFKYAQDLFAPMSEVYGLAPWLAVSVPIAICWLVAIIAVRRAA